MIPFRSDEQPSRSSPAVVLVAGQGAAWRVEARSVDTLRALPGLGIDMADVQFDCAAASPEAIGVAASCGVRRFVVEPPTNLQLLPSGAQVVVRVEADDRPVIRCLLAGLRVVGIAVERGHMMEAPELCARLALDGITLSAVQAPGPLTAEERRALMGACALHGARFWEEMGPLDAVAGRSMPGPA